MSRRQPMRKEPVRDAIHHLCQYLTLIAPTSRRAEAMARTTEEALATRMGFKAILERIERCAIDLAEDLDEEAVSQQLTNVLEELHRLPQWKRAMDAKNAADRRFKKIRDAKSLNHPEMTCFEVELTRDSHVFGDWLLGRVCFVDDQPWFAVGVEWSELLKPPFKAGTPIRLVVKSMEEVRSAGGAPQDSAQAKEPGEPGGDPVEPSPGDRRQADEGRDAGQA